MMLSIVLLLNLYKSSGLTENTNIAMPTPEEYANYACTKDPMTYIVEIKIHSQQQVAEAIQAVYNYGSDIKLGIKASSLPYYGEIVDELNSMLLKFKVQIHLNLDAPIVEEFMTDINFDRSCEIRDPIIERTSAAFGLLKSKYNNSLGLHLFVWECPRYDPSFVVEQKIDNDNCGRVLGILWRGTEEGREDIKNVIMYALTGISGDYSSPAAFDKIIEAPLCSYVNKCIARNPTDIGEKVLGEEYLRYTDEISNQ